MLSGFNLFIWSFSFDTVFRYFSPYPVTDSETNDAASSSAPRDSSTPAGPSQKVVGVARSSMRAHGRTSDLLAGGLNRNHSRLEQSVLWVCDRCFKYMTDGTLWEVHIVRAWCSSAKLF